MLSELLTNHGEAAFIVVLLGVAFLGVLLSRRKSRSEKPDPPSIFGPIRGMYVCYQCDTVFNTAQCPVCHEEATIPLIHLTGSVILNERLTAMMGRIKERSAWNSQTIGESEAATPVPASRPATSNGAATELH